MPRADTEYWRKLRDLLAEFYDDVGMIRVVAESAGIDVARVALAGAPIVIWSSVLGEARKSNRTLLGLTQQVLRMYGENPRVRDLLAQMPKAESVVTAVDNRFDEVLQRMDNLEAGQSKQTTAIEGVERSVGALQADMSGLRTSLLRAGGVLGNWAANGD